MREKSVRISVSLPSDLHRELDRLIRELRYKRSRAIQEAIRIFIDEHTWHTEGEYVYGTLNILYDHNAWGLEEALTDIQHSYMDVISSALHLHVDERNCLLVIAVKGESSRIKGLIDSIAGRAGVKRLKAVTFTT